MVKPISRASIPQIPVQAPTPAAKTAQEAPSAPSRVAGDTLERQVTATHRNGSIDASDGARIAYRTSDPVGAPKAVVVMQQGTYGKAEYFDAMGEKLAESGIRSYALGSRVETKDYRQHAADLEAVVEQARRENPGVPVSVMGVSLGAAIALNWSARFNDEGHPVVAMSPVVPPFSRYLGIGESLTIGLGLVSDRMADKRVNSPMSAGVPLTTNPDSPQYRLSNPEQLTVPARLFGDVVKMTAEVAAKGPQMKGPVFFAMAGEDQVAVNGAGRAFSRLIHADDKQVMTFPGTGHDLSQETHRPELVEALSRWVLKAR